MSYRKNNVKIMEINKEFSMVLFETPEIIFDEPIPRINYPGVELIFFKESSIKGKLLEDSSKKRVLENLRCFVTHQLRNMGDKLDFKTKKLLDLIVKSDGLFEVTLRKEDNDGIVFHCELIEFIRPGRNKKGGGRTEKSVLHISTLLEEK